MESNNNKQLQGSMSMRQQIIEWCKELAQSQGFYGRLLAHLTSKAGEPTLEALAAKNFNGIVDFVLFVEC